MNGDFSIMKALARGEYPSVYISPEGVRAGVAILLGVFALAALVSFAFGA